MSIKVEIKHVGNFPPVPQRMEYRTVTNELRDNNYYSPYQIIDGNSGQIVVDLGERTPTTVQFYQRLYDLAATNQLLVMWNPYDN